MRASKTLQSTPDPAPRPRSTQATQKNIRNNIINLLPNADHSKIIAYNKFQFNHWVKKTLDNIDVLVPFVEQHPGIGYVVYDAFVSKSNDTVPFMTLIDTILDGSILSKSKPILGKNKARRLRNEKVLSILSMLRRLQNILNQYLMNPHQEMNIQQQKEWIRTQLEKNAFKKYQKTQAPDAQGKYSTMYIESFVDKKSEYKGRRLPVSYQKGPSETFHERFNSLKKGTLDDLAKISQNHNIQVFKIHGPSKKGRTIHVSSTFPRQHLIKEILKAEYGRQQQGRASSTTSLPASPSSSTSSQPQTKRTKL